MVSLAADAIVLLTETWLNAGIYDGELFGSMPYTVHHHDRRSRAGDVLRATFTSLPANRRANIELPDIEAVFLDLLLPQGTTLLGCIYCPPSSRDKAFKLLDSSLTQVPIGHYSDIIMMRNFNAHIN